MAGAARVAMKELTDEQVIEVLAKREGYEHAGGGWYQNEQMRRVGAMTRNLPPYLTSRDALAGVLEKLTVPEWCALDENLREDYQNREFRIWAFSHWLLTIPPSTLARAIAGVISK